jgi:cell shape-determining protein MreC
LTVEHASLMLPKTEEETAVESLIEVEVQTVAEEFIAPFRAVVQSRMKLKETEIELRVLIADLTEKLSVLTDLKRENATLEREVLTQIKAKL